MTIWLLSAIVLACAVTAIPVLVHLVREEVTSDLTFALLAVAEVLLIVQLVWGCLALGSTQHDVDGVVFVSYLVTNVLVLPVGAAFSLAERSRGGTAVLLLALLTVAGLQARLWDIWGGA